MLERQKPQKSHNEEVFDEVLALYQTLHDIGSFRVTRAEMRQGEVRAEPIDFAIDVDLKASRCLNKLGNPIFWGKMMQDPRTYVEPNIREALGKTFDENNLGVEGAYKVLYFRVKNNK